jgi:hypothetical protein
MDVHQLKNLESASWLLSLVMFAIQAQSFILSLLFNLTRNIQSHQAGFLMA